MSALVTMDILETISNVSHGANYTEDKITSYDDKEEYEYYYEYYEWYLNDLGYAIFETIFLTFGTFVVGVIGTVTNIINIIVFYRQGLLQDSCTASLVALAISDCIISFFKIIASVLFIPYEVVKFMEVDHNQAMINSLALGDLINSYLMTFTAITGWITVYISLERVVSVMFPFHVKRLFTPKRTYVILVGIFLVTNLLYLPKNMNFIINSPGTSNTSVSLSYDVTVFVGLVPVVTTVIFIILNDVALRVLCLGIVIILNVVLVVKVNMSRSFRKSATVSSSTNQSSSNKELVLTKMMITLSTIFIVCYFPSCLEKLAYYFSIFDKEIIIDIIDTIATSLDSVNSAFNIFIYTTMSSRFRKELRRLCGRGDKELA